MRARGHRDPGSGVPRLRSGGSNLRQQPLRPFMVAVNCVEPGATCFCTSMETGPRARTGYDLAMTEVIGDGVHHFVVEAGSDIGKRKCSRRSRPGWQPPTKLKRRSGWWARQGEDGSFARHGRHQRAALRSSR